MRKILIFLYNAISRSNLPFERRIMSKEFGIKYLFTWYAISTFSITFAAAGQYKTPQKGQ